MAIATCIECDAEITIEGRATLGMVVICDHCGAELEVVSLDPLELDWADGGDDSDDDDWDEEAYELDSDAEDGLDDDDLDDLSEDLDDDLEEDDDWR